METQKNCDVWTVERIYLEILSLRSFLNWSFDFPATRSTVLYFTCSIYKWTHSDTEHPLSISDDNQGLLFFLRERKDVAFFSSRQVLSWDFKHSIFVLLVKQCTVIYGRFLQNMFSLRNPPQKRHCSTGNKKKGNSEKQLCDWPLQ
jgi:hypothetical protein